MASSNARATTRWGPGAARLPQVCYRRANSVGVYGCNDSPRQSTPCVKLGHPVHAGRGSRSGCPGRSEMHQPCCVVHRADMVRDPGPPGDPVLGTSPAFGRRIVARFNTRPVLLHTCGHTCGQPWGAATVGTPAADDLWAKVAAAVRAQLSEATWNTWFQGVHALDLSDDTLILGVPELGHDRTPPHQLPRPAQRRGPGAHRRPARRLADRRHHAPARGAGHARSAHAPAGRGRSRRRGPPRRREPHRHGLAHHVAESPLHLRPVRDRRLEPLRPRGRDVGRREPGPFLQPAVHLRARPVWARPTCCTRSATTYASCSRASAFATCPPRR